MTSKQQTSVLQLIIGMSIGVCVTLIYTSMTQDGPIQSIETTRETSWKYEFIQPLLECNSDGEASNKRYIPFEKKLKEEILEYQSQYHSGSYLSFYFRDLQNWPWFSNNYQEGFYPASLLKTPILVWYIKWAEMDPSILKQKIKVEQYDYAKQNYVPEKHAEIGKEYTVEELLEIMILYSDNNASSNLLIRLPEALSEDVFNTFQVPSPKDKTAENYKLNVKEYASFFRILFNASYLSNAWSEAALTLLSKVSFDRGITGKLPKDIKVAHKFWERVYTEDLWDGKVRERAQLHDCGIVYYPGSPYLICIMTRGNTLDELSVMTQDISKMIYDTVDGTRRKAQ